MKKNYWKHFGLFGLVIVLVALLVSGCASPAPPAVETPVDTESPEPEEPADVANEYRDGIVEAISQGNERGYVQVTLTLENDEVVNVNIVEYDGLGVEKVYADYGIRFPQLEEAHTTLAENMVRENTWDVDVFTGATGTSEKAREAARFALEKARVEPADSTYLDGTFMAISDMTERGWGIAWVTLENDEIVDVKLAGTTPAQEDGEPVYDEVGRQVFALKTDEYPYEPYHEAKSVVTEDILDNQTPDVDIFTGATGSSNQWMQAVERALDWAKTR